MEYNIVSTLNDKQISQLETMFENTFWADGRKRPQIDKMLQNSDIVIGILDAEENLLAFCRLLTDYTYRAILYDMFVDPNQRKQGLGKLLMDTIINHPALNGVEHIDLNCKVELLPFYHHWQFTENTSGMRLMRRYHANSEVSN